MTPSFSLDRVGFWLDYTVWLDIISVIPFYVDLASGGSDEQGIPLTIAHNNYHLVSNQIQFMRSCPPENHLQPEISLLPDMMAGSSSPTYYNLLKIARISRCLKIVRRSEKLLMIIDILVGCTAELVLLSFVWCLG